MNIHRCPSEFGTHSFESHSKIMMILQWKMDTKWEMVFVNHITWVLMREKAKSSNVWMETLSTKWQHRLTTRVTDDRSSCSHLFIPMSPSHVIFENSPSSLSLLNSCQIERFSFNHNYAKASWNLYNLKILISNWISY